ncbi:MAG: ABC transporter substrate-binding protein [Pyrinomonadaceae bacterium]
MPEKNSLRIASLLPSTTEILCALGLEENIIGITHECDFPESIQNKPHLTASRISHETMSSAEIDHAVRSQLDGHGSIYDLNEKLLAELKPDLILTQELCEVCAVSYKTVQKAAKMFVADAKVVSLEPNTIGDIFENIKTVGELCGVREKAEKVVANLENRLTRSARKNRKSEKIAQEFLCSNGSNRRLRPDIGRPNKSRLPAEIVCSAKRVKNHRRQLTKRFLMNNRRFWF